jgi:segregation and condensation protein A
MNDSIEHPSPDHPEDRYQIHLDNIFDGPMDLLLHLIKKNEVDIYDIPIALITDQYLAYLDWMKLMNIDYAGDFLLMASTLAHIKSRMLLPLHGLEDEDEEDPRMEIARPLMEYMQMKIAAEELADRNLLGDKTFIRQTPSDEIAFEREEPYIRVGLFELIDAFQRILDKVPEDQQLDLTADTISVKDRITQIVDILEEKNSVTFTELFEAEVAKSDIIVTFLALLEMVKLNLIAIVQHIQSGILRIVYQ